jgi:hypothetical protein
MSVTIIVGTRHALAALFLFVFAALAGGALIAPPATEALTTTYTRSASCAGLDFYPTDSRTEYDNDSTLRVWRVGSTAPIGTGVFRCDPGLPTGAVVTKVQFTGLQFDPTATGTGEGLGTCALVRSGLTTATARTAQTLASASFGTSVGVVRVTTSSITNATIDNANWGYWLQCAFTWSWGWPDTAHTGLYGADVIYTITAAKG